MSEIIEYNDQDLLNPEVNFEDKISIAIRIAKPLANLINEREMYVEISGRKHVFIEGWNTLGTMLGLAPMTVRIRPLEEHEVKTSRAWDKVIAYEAEVEIRTKDGIPISNAKSICTNLEKGKWDNDHYAIWSMAETRAKGKAYRSALSWIMELSGYAPTPAEEMPVNGFKNGNKSASKEVKKTVLKGGVQDGDFKKKETTSKELNDSYKETVEDNDTLNNTDERNYKSTFTPEQEQKLSENRVTNDCMNTIIARKDELNRITMTTEINELLGYKNIVPEEADEAKKLVMSV